MNPNDSLPENQNEARPHTPDMDSTLPPGADAEERFNEFWRQNGSSIFISICLGAVIVIGAQTWRYLDHRAELKTREAYAQATTSDQLIAFAEGHAKHQLAGAAYMQIANEEYTKGQYLQAAGHYNLARETLGGTPFGERAQLGAAISELIDGRTEAALTDLHAVLDNPNFLEVTRAEAAFNLGLYYMQKQDYPALTAIADIADTFGAENTYAEMARRLRNQIPEQK